MNATTVKARPGMLRTALANYRDSKRQWFAALETGDDALRSATVCDFLRDEQEMATLVVMLVGKEPVEDHPIGVVLDGVPIVVARRDGVTVVEIPDGESYVGFRQA